MATIRFSHTDSIIAQAQCERSWMLPITGNVGQATITLRYDNPAADSNYINMQSGSRVFVYDSDGCGTWVGTITDIDEGPDALRLTAKQPHEILGVRHVTLTGTLRTTSPNAVAYAALTNAGDVFGLHTLDGPWDASGPVIESYGFNGQDAWSVVTAMQEQSDGELNVADDGGLTWCGPFARATTYGTLLQAGSNLRAWSIRTNGGDRIAEAIAIADGVPYRATDGSVAAQGGRPAQAVISAPNARAAQRLADTELANRSQPAITITGSVGVTHWGIRERMFVRVIIPRRGGVAARAYACRVIGRAVSDSSSLMGLTLLVVDAVPSRPRMRPTATTAARGRGTGSIAQRLVRLNRDRGAA